MAYNIKTEYIVNNSGNDYVGINLTENRINIHLPIGYRITENEIDTDILKKEIRKLFELLALKSTNGYETIKESGNFNLICAVRVLTDYIKYGLYQENEKETKNNIKGKINWHKTLHEKQLYINNKFIFNNIYYNKINYNAEKEIQNIQKYCLNIISKILGKYWNIYFYEEIKEKYNKYEMIKILKNEIRKINQDKKLEILKNLLNFINDSNFKLTNKSNISFKYKEFEYIWQNLIDIQGIKGNEKKRYQPKAKYYEFNLEECKDRRVRPSLPDTIIIDDNEKVVFILDAKYYAEGNIPNEYDIFKQTRYGEYVRSKVRESERKNYKIINSFVLPKNLNDDIIKIEDKFAFCEKNNLNNEINDYEIILISYIDTRKLIDNPNEVINKIKIELIEKYKNNFEKIIENIKNK